jgi:hypothetical protein
MNRNGGEPGTDSTGNYASNPFGDASFEFGQDSLANRPTRRVGGVRSDAMDFGGYREKGGPVDARKAYVVGENGPEVIVPTRPGVVVPNHLLPPSGMMPPGMPPGMTEPLAGRREQGGPVEAGKPYLMGEAGKEVVVPYGALPFGMRPEQSKISQSPMNRPYGSDARTMIQGGAPSQFDQLQMGGFGAGSLANAPARPVGRSIAAHPERRLEIAERTAVMNNDDAGAARIALARRGLQLADARDQFGMWSAQQTAEANADKAQQEFFEKRRAEMLAAEIWKRDQQAELDKEERAHRWEMTTSGIKTGYDAMEAERKRKQDEMERSQALEFGLKRIPTPGNSTPFFQSFKGSVFTGSADPNGPAVPIQNVQIPGTNLYDAQQNGRSVPGVGLLEKQQGPFREGLTKMKPVTKGERPHIEMIGDGDKKIPYSVYTDPETGQVIMRKVKMLDENGDGVDDRAETSPAAAPAPQQGGWKALLPRNSTGAGVKSLRGF